ncbi:hypothetical protein BCV70DRAFT_196815 [Testicularia cyperi]|uniref:CID domain-containing protein n=1 Tax=Testicularia cyperi TaxID=1882483 RepID=A0A317XXF0_9BASI|nr:hypothetical protein BCV70DRAFT_196815 [Testicularia cyperi]
MDPFQVRLRFVSTLDKLNASQPTIRASLNFVAQYAPALAPELWDCIMDECRKGSLNRRMNLLFLIDSIFTDDSSIPMSIRLLFQPYLIRDLYGIFDLTVPEARWDGTLNLSTSKKILESWKQKAVLEPDVLRDVQLMLETREQEYHALSPGSKKLSGLSSTDIVRRMEEDRERHKRLRERAWILPPSSTSHTALWGTRPEQLNPTFLARHFPITDQDQRDDPDKDRIWSSQDLDFDHLWEQTSDLNEDDLEHIHEHERLGWAHESTTTPTAAVPTSAA